jgi:hypothetical protein
LSPLRESAGEGAVSDEEPPSLIIGRDDENHWVVVEAHGRCGGMFATEAAAVRYAREESRGRPGAVLSAPQHIALNIGSAPRAARTISRS